MNDCAVADTCVLSPECLADHMTARLQAGEEEDDYLLCDNWIEEIR